MEFISKLSLLQAAATDLLAPKRCAYSNFQIHKQVSQYPNLKCQILEVQCGRQRGSFTVYYIKNQYKQKQSCIIYLHGLSSFVLEGKFLLPYLEEEFSLCLYDLAGHGKNRIGRITYGVEEANDLYLLVNVLRKKGIDKINLWGRSMGAATILYFLKVYGEKEYIKNMVRFTVLDSPFCSFEQIAKQTMGKTIKLPGFICSPLVYATMRKVFQKYNINLRLLNFVHLNDISYPAIFIYSQKDQIVNYNHSIEIIKDYGGFCTVLKNSFDHNQPRDSSLIKQVINLLTKKSIKNKQNNSYSKPLTKRGLSMSLVQGQSIANEQYNEIELPHMISYINRQKIKSSHECNHKIDSKNRGKLIQISNNVCWKDKMGSNKIHN